MYHYKLLVFNKALPKCFVSIQRSTPDQFVSAAIVAH